MKSERKNIIVTKLDWNGNRKERSTLLYSIDITGLNLRSGARRTLSNNITAICNPRFVLI